MKALVNVRHAKTLSDLPFGVEAVQLARANAYAKRRLWQSTVNDELKHGRYDVFNPHFAYYAWGPVTQSAIHEIPIVTHFHGPWAYESRVEHHGPFKHIRFALQKTIENRVYRSSDQFIVLSSSFQKVLEDDYGVPEDRIHVIPGGVDVHRFHPTEDVEMVRRELGLPQDRIILVSVRRLARRMGLDRLVHAVSVLRRDFPNLLTIVVGTGDLENELRSLVSELNLEEHIWFVGKVSDAQLPRYYQAADLSVVPSVAFEGFGLITIESLACGTPVLGTPVGGTSEILRGLSQGLLSNGTSTMDLVEGIGTVLSHPSRLPSSLQCREYVMKHYTWDVIIPLIEDVFASALNDKKHKSGREHGLFHYQLRRQPGTTDDVITDR